MLALKGPKTVPMRDKQRKLQQPKQQRNGLILLVFPL
jgi:hypothetical protein